MKTPNIVPSFFAEPLFGSCRTLGRGVSEFAAAVFDFLSCQPVHLHVQLSCWCLIRLCSVCESAAFAHLVAVILPHSGVKVKFASCCLSLVIDRK